MWLGKLSLRAAALVLVGAVSSVFAQAPLDISADDWNYLSNFKLWGTNGIETKNRPEFYDSRFYDRKNESDFSGYNGVLPDTLGWVGTAKGDLTTDEVGWFDGPIIVGGAVTVPSNYDVSRRAYLLTGPIRTTGGIGSARNRGTVCQGTNKSGACANVPEIRPNLSVPGLKGATLSQTYNVSDKTTLKVSDYCSANAICDIYFSSINFSNDSRLVVQMPEDGQPTRIFTNSISFGTHPEIVVAYQGKGELKLNEYDGNLLIYSNGDINFDNTDNVPIMGTIVSKGTITLGRNMIFAGQFIADTIKVGNEIKAETFVFKKFDPKIEISVGNNSKKIKENNNWESIDIVLSEESKKDVSFNYCFAFYSADGVHGKYAGHDDVGAKDASHAFPICGVSQTKVTIPAGKKKAEGIAIKPLIDGLVETDEALWFQISDLDGADLTSDYEKDYGYKIYIVSNDEFPTVKTALTFDVNEDEEHTFTKAEFQFQHATQEFASVIITSLPNKGSLVLNGTKLTSAGAGITVAVKDLGKLTYQAAANEFGNKYATFKYKVVGDGVEGGNTSGEYTATVNVIPVNDEPSADNATFTVSEHPSKDAVVGTIKPKDVANELNVDSYKFTLVSSSSGYSDFSKVFVLTESGTVQVKGNVSFDAHQKDTYTVTARITDDAKTEKNAGVNIKGPLYSDFTITIKIDDENDIPTIGPQTFTKPEKQSNGKDWPAGEFVGKVTTASDLDGDPLTYSIVTSGVPFKFQNGNELVITDGSKLDYETKPTWKFMVQVDDGKTAQDKLPSAEITVNLTDVNEPPPPFGLNNEYVVNENSAKGTVLGTFIVKDYDKVSGQFETLTYTLTGALTGAVNTKGTLTNKSMADIFEVVEKDVNGGERKVEIRVKNQSLLNYEELHNLSTKKASYEVKITAKDSKNHSVSNTTFITIKDVNEDVSAKGGTFYVNEHSPIGSPVCAEVYKDANKKPLDCNNVAKVEGKDEDLYTDSFKNLTYTMSANNTGTMASDASKFTVGKYDGKLSISAELDYESATKRKFTFKVTVSDGTFKKDADVTIVLEDIEEPVITFDYDGAATVEEHSETGRVVDEFEKILEEIKAKDADIRNELNKISGRISYEIDQAASANAKDIFYIDSDMGIITVDDGSKLDFEALYPNNTYTVVIKAYGTSSNGSEVFVNINRNIAVTDINENPVITGASQSTQNKLPSGVTRKSFEIYVPETWMNRDGSIGNVLASDPDNAYGTQHPAGFNKLTYSVKEVLSVGGSTEFPFELDPNTGVFTVADGKELNYTKQSEYKCVVRVADNPKLFDDKGHLLYAAKEDLETIIIHVTDINRPSEFRVVTNPYDVDENENVGTKLNGDYIVVYDEDDADVNQLKISITDNNATSARNAAKLFEVVQVGNTNTTTHESEFVIKTKANIDYEEYYKATENGAIFDITLTIKDRNNNTTTQNTKIRVNDVNEEPAFTEPSYTFSVREDVAKGKVLGTAEATDPDRYNASYGTLYFSLEGEEAAPFDIDVSTGEISVKSATLDYETKSSYSFEAVVTDKEYTKRVPVTVSVLNVREKPIFPTVPNLAVDENSDIGTMVGTVKADDDDCKNGHNCKNPTYTLAATNTSASDYKSFKIDEKSGTIKVNGALNYEDKNEYFVRVVATDGDDQTLSTYVDVTIKINDVNDKPIYAENEYHFEIHENAPVGEFVGAVVADDEDFWSKLTYALSDYTEGSKDASAFRIEDGKIYLTSTTLNFEKKKRYEIVAHATDNGKSYGATIGRTFEDYTASTIVYIDLIDDPDAPKIIDDGKKSYDVAENTADNNTPTGKEIACYQVVDEDKGQLANLVPYVTDMGNTDADRIFGAKIKKDSLCLIVKDASKLDYETNKHVHKITVEVMDADNLTAKVEKTINIIDVNEMPIISGNTSFSFYENKAANSVIGKLYPDDIDTSAVFTQNIFTPVGGDTALFTISEDGKIKSKRVFDYEKEERYKFELEVKLSDKDSKKYPKLTTKTTITLTLKDEPEIPVITSKEFNVDENSKESVFIGVLKAVDPDGEGLLLFELAEKSPYVTVSPEGEIKVAKDAKIDYETMQQFTIKVKVKDTDGMYSVSDVVIKVNDLNEPPSIKPQEYTFPEDSKPGTKKGPVKATDPDTKNKKFSDLKFYAVEEHEKFEIKTNGDIVLKSELDYEKEKSYVIKVYVTDGEFFDTTDVTINVGNVVEKTEVEITRVEAGDSIYVKPKKEDPIYTNKDVILVEWKQEGKMMSSLDSLKEGCQFIIKKYKAPNKDVEGADTIEVCYSTAAPIVEVDAKKTKVEAENIYTIVEDVDKKDSSIYVNDKKKEVSVIVNDTVSKYKETFKVDVVLDTVAISDKTVKNMVDISKSEIVLEKNPKTDVYEKSFGDNKTQISYKKVVNGDTVTVSYFVDSKGEIIKTTVVDENGEKKKIDVIEISKTVVVKGKNAVVSYKADAKTGKILYGDSEGNLLVDASTAADSKTKGGSADSGSVSYSADKNDFDLKTGVGAFTVTYDAKGVEGNKAIVSYVVDEKGKIVANEEGDRGYLVTYTFTNRYGNTAEKSVFMVLDKTKPIVVINSPADGDVVYANFVDVDWCIAIDGDEKHCEKQDSLSFQSLEKGVNTIKRIYRDKAGNETIAEIKVMMKKAKDVNINLEKPMVLVSIDSVKKYYEENPPEEDQTYSVSIYNPKTDKEVEVIKGSGDDSKKGSGEEPYPGLGAHIGPTVTIDMKLPIVSAVGGLATLDDIIINGNMVALDGVDADSSAKSSVTDYVKKYCSTEFQDEYNNTKDISTLTLYDTKARVTLWYYTTPGGHFVDEYHFDYDIENADYVDKAGLVKFFFELKPDLDGELRNADGRLYGTGPYIVKTRVDIRSKQRCVVPPVNGNSKIGDILKSSDQMMKRFGYRRPVLRGNEKASFKKGKKDFKKDSKKSEEKK